MPTLFASSDIRHACRRLIRTPLFTVLTIGVLAGGLAVSIFTFAFLRTAMMAPLPLEEGEQIVRLLGVIPGGGSTSLDAATFARLRPGIQTLTDVGVYTERGVTLGSGAGARAIPVTATEPSLFALARVQAALGRGLSPDDAARGAEPVLVLGHALWQSALGGDPAIVGRTIELNGMMTRVVGIMPPGFGFPVAAEAWAPIEQELVDLLSAPPVPIAIFARLAPGVTRQEAEAELAVLLGRVLADHPRSPGVESEATGIRLRTYPMAQIGDEGPMVLAVLNLVAGLILLLACINVGNLLLARANERGRELAVRQALGAPRARLVMQNLWESVILCGVGGTLASVMATGGLRVIDGWAQANLEGNLAFWWRWGFNPSVVLAAGGFVTIAIAMLGGLVSARATSEQFLDTLRESAPGAGGKAGGRMARALVVSQIVVVSLVMFAGGLAAIVGARVVTMDLGYDSSRLLSASIDLPPDRYPNAARLSSTQAAIADRIEQQPGVASVMIRSALADLGDAESGFEVAGRPVSGLEFPQAYVQAILRPLAPLGVPIVAGRFVAATDDADSEPVAMVSQSVARQFWGGESPIGRQLRMVGVEGPEAPWRTVVGVSGDLLMGNPLSRDRSPLAIYLPLGQAPARTVSILVQHHGSETAGRVAVLETLAAIDPLMSPASIASLDEILTKSARMATATARMFGGCFLFALLLAVSGTYGLMARAIARRTREIGVRRALGASDGQVVRLLLGQGARQLAVGALIALPLTVLAGLGFSRVFPISGALAVGTALSVSVVVTGTVLAATWLPARGAIRVAPSEVLRAE